MNALLVAIVTWLSVNFELPADYDIPEVRFAPANEIVALHHGGITPEDRQVTHEDYDSVPGDRLMRAPVLKGYNFKERGSELSKACLKWLWRRC